MKEEYEALRNAWQFLVGSLLSVCGMDMLLFRLFLRLSLDRSIDRVSATQMQQPPGTSEIHDH